MARKNKKTVLLVFWSVYFKRQLCEYCSDFHRVEEITKATNISLFCCGFLHNMICTDMINTIISFNFLGYFFSSKRLSPYNCDEGPPCHWHLKYIHIYNFTSNTMSLEQVMLIDMRYPFLTNQFSSLSFLLWELP